MEGGDGGKLLMWLVWGRWCSILALLDGGENRGVDDRRVTGSRRLRV
jgi:hypothetical protein